MNRRSKNITVFIGMLVLASLIYAWSYPLNKGQLSVETGLDSYKITIDENSILCDQDPCITPLETGPYQVKIQKDGYSAQTLDIYIKRGKTNTISTELKKIPTLTISPIVPKSKGDVVVKKLPQELQNISIMTSAWDLSRNKFAFVDKEDSRLKIWSNNEGLKNITTLKNIGEGFSLHWSPNQSYLFGNEKAEIYFINIESASRKKKVIDFTLHNITWFLDGNNILINDKNNKLYKIVFSEEVVESLETTLDLENAEWINEEEFIFFTSNEKENISIILSYNIAKQETEEIVKKFNFPINNIGIDANKTVYFHNSKDETWYKLDY